MRKLGRGSSAVRAAAVVEMAIVSPLLFALLFGIIEFGWLFTVRHTMVNAAREGARLGVLQGVESSDVISRVNDYLEPMGLDGKATVTYTDATDDDPTVTVRVTVPRNDVSLVGSFFGFSGGTVEGSASMRKEGQ